ncbi:MAG: DUF4388 domain-containing protein [Nannocystis sp.]|nr:DUF4388 domain-containing protein [Nannocystis sp.]MBA3547177.1 DUF4388 domain-containing protein [Nannocystis sp.]
MQDTHSQEPPPGASLIGPAGDLRNVQIPELLWQLHKAGRTGCLRVQRGDVVKLLWLIHGQPVFARSNQSGDRLTDRLLARGLLSRAQYDAAQHLIATREGKRIGELLIEAGLIRSRELNEALGEHLLRMLDAMFLWVDGSYRFEPDLICTEPVTLDKPTAAIIMGGARHRIPLRRLWEAVGLRDQRPQLSDLDRSDAGRGALVAELRLEPSEANWLAQLDGSRTLGVMLRDFDADEHELLSLTYTLKLMGRLELITRAHLPFIPKP